MITAELCHYVKNHLTVYFKWMNFMVCEIHLNIAVNNIQMETVKSKVFFFLLLLAANSLPQKLPLINFLDVVPKIFYLYSSTCTYVFLCNLLHKPNTVLYLTFSFKNVSWRHKQREECPVKIVADRNNRSTRQRMRKTYQ